MANLSGIIIPVQTGECESKTAEGPFPENQPISRMGQIPMYGMRKRGGVNVKSRGFKRVTPSLRFYAVWAFVSFGARNRNVSSIELPANAAQLSSETLPINNPAMIGAIIDAIEARL